LAKANPHNRICTTVPLLEGIEKFNRGARPDILADVVKHAVLILAVVVMFGILVPLMRGYDFLSPVMVTAYACLALLFVAPASAEAFSNQSRPETPVDVVRKLASVVLYGWGIAVVILVTGIVTINVAKWTGQLLTPGKWLAFSALLFSLTASVAAASLAAFLGRRMSPRMVKGLFRAGFLLLLMVVFFGHLAEYRTASEVTGLCLEASAILTAIAVALLFPVLRAPRVRQT
jgi:hypothetical protein